MESKLLHVISFVLIFITALAGCSRGDNVRNAGKTPSLLTQTPEVVVIQTILPQPTSTSAPSSGEFNVTIYFTDRNLYAAGTPPFEVGVTRTVSSPNLAEAVLLEFFKGPTVEEQVKGLELITSGFNSLSSLVIEGGIARVYLAGKCASMGATYTIAQPIMRNLLQFSEISYVKIYDENGSTEDPDSQANSIPFCLEP